MFNFGSLIKKIDRDDYLVLILVTFFLISRLLMFAVGMNFNMNYLVTAWQNVDVWLLKNDLLRSIWYLHSQPPIFNLFTGVILKLFPVNFSIFFQLFFHFLGLVLSLCLYYIIKNTSSNRLLSFLISLLFILGPSVILFESFFFYDFFVLVVLVVITFFFQKFTQTNKFYYLWAFFLSAAFLVLTRRIFHLVWFLIMGLILLYFYRTDWKRILLAFFIPLLFIVFWYGKNFYYFGNFDASSWSGMGFFKTINFTLTNEEREDLFNKGIVSSNIFYGDPYIIPINTTTVSAATFSNKIFSVPVVGEYNKKDGRINYNYYGYINLSREVMDDFISILKNRPLVYIKAIIATGIIYFAPASNYFAPSGGGDGSVDPNYALIRRWDVFYNKIIYGQPLSWGGERLQNYISDILNIRKTQAWRLLSPGIFIVVVYLVSFIYGLKVIFQKNAIFVYGRDVYITIIFLVLNIFYVSAVGILAEAGENQRHRFMIEALVWVLFALFIQDTFLKKRVKL